MDNKCGQCGASTVETCNANGCFYLENGNGEPEKCCEISAEDRALLQAGDYTPEELFGVGGKPSCPKCV